MNSAVQSPLNLILHSSCRDEPEETPRHDREMTLATAAWRELVVDTAQFSCDVLLLSDTAAAKDKMFADTLLDPCGPYNQLTLMTKLVEADSYTLSLTSCRLGPVSVSSSNDATAQGVLLSVGAEPSSWHFSWIANSHVDQHVVFDLTEAKSQFLKVWANAENANNSAEQQEDKALVIPVTTEVTQHVEYSAAKEAVVSQEALPSLPTCPAQMPPVQSLSAPVAHDPRFVRLETLMESELNDINCILHILAVMGLILFVSFLWTAFRLSRNPTPKTSVAFVSKSKQVLQSCRYPYSSLRHTAAGPPIESLSMRAVSGRTRNLSPLSLDTVLAAQGDDDNDDNKASCETPTLVYGPVRRSRHSTRTPQQQLVVDPEAATNEPNSKLSPCSKFAAEWAKSKSARRSFRRDSSSPDRKFVLSPPVHGTTAVDNDSVSMASAAIDALSKRAVTIPMLAQHKIVATNKPVLQQQDDRFMLASNEPPSKTPSFVHEYWGARI